MASTTPARPAPHDRLWAGPLALGSLLFAATGAVGLIVVWIVDPDAEPGVGLIAVPLLSLAILVASGVADRTWSSRATGTAELGNTARMLALVALLLTVPAFLLHAVDDPATRGDVTAARIDGARGIDRSCPAGAVPSTGVRDATVGGTHERTVDCLAWWGVADDTSATFDPEAELTREQAATFLARLVPAAGGQLPRLGPDRFEDDARSAHQASINRVVDAGIMGGLDDGRFAPGAPVTRAQLATMLVRAYEHVAGERLLVAGADGFADDDASVHERAIDQAAAAGFVAGVSKSAFAPSQPVTRGQLATLLARFLDKAVADGYASLPTSNPRTSVP